MLHSHLTSTDPARLWRHYIQLTEIEQAFKEFKSDLRLRPIYHQLDHRIEAHIFVAFIAYCLQVTLKFQARQLAQGLTPSAILEKFSAIQMIDTSISPPPRVAPSSCPAIPNPIPTSHSGCSA